MTSDAHNARRLVVIVTTWANPFGSALWHKQLHYNSAGANSSLQDCNNPVATGFLPSSISLPLPPHKPKIAIIHHPRLVADLGLSHWFVCLCVCVNCVCVCVTRSQLLFFCPVETGLGRLHPVSPCPLPLSSSLSHIHFFSLWWHPTLFTQTMKPKENVLMSRINFSCASKRHHEHCFVSEQPHNEKNGVGNRVQLYCW